jgi:excinuclease UvrABC nuclease subunit
MKFKIERPNKNILFLIRAIGYIFLEKNNEELNCVRSLSNQHYPRFHLFIKEDKIRGLFSFNLHLDQKKVSYSGSPAHSGENKGEIVENEKERILKIINSFT